ncbi:solute carrier family 46 member 3-like [Gigantopelta aegis]|uniref:solute carrier family 46 member 3-like n=1 Tax=Gigantopelta aegis TaxID=1735272 RepID=UPI001B88D2E5|nr:solute carrier family 46 member 3-like [Gigantopelta aegis]
MATEDDETKPLISVNETTIRKVSFIRGAVPCGIIMMLYFLSGFIFISWIPQYVHQRLYESYTNSSSKSNHYVYSCNRTESDNNTLLEIKLQKETSERVVYYSYANSLPTLLVNLVMGSYSDSIGRKLFFVIPIIGCLGKGVVSMLVVKLNLDLNYFYLAYGLEGIGGSFSTFLLATYAYTADITPPKNKRTLAIAALEVLLATGTISGKFATGLLIKSTGFFFPMVLNSGLGLLTLLFVIFFLVETTHGSEDSGKSPLSHLKNVFGFYLLTGSRRRRLQYVIVMLIFCLGLVGRFGRDNTETLYVLNQPFCWLPDKIGYFGALRTGLTSLVTMLFIKACLTCLRDEYIIATGMLGEIGGLVLEAMATSDLMMWLVPVVSSSEATSSPITRSMLSRMTSPSQQGAVFASIATLETITNFVANTMYGLIYSATVGGSVRGAVFLIMSVWPFLAIVASISHVFVAEKETEDTVVVVEDPGKQNVSC